jgi:hypothetical protein
MTTSRKTAHQPHFVTNIFYADEEHCGEWDAQLLSEFPFLATTTEEWRTKPGWYWRRSTGSQVLHDDGPFKTRQECERNAERVRALEALSPEGLLVWAGLTRPKTTS